MARKKANVLKMEKQRRARVDELRLSELNRNAHSRATDNRVVVDIYGIVPDDITRDFANCIRKLVGLGECDIKSSREEVLAKINWVTQYAVRLYSVKDRSMYLIQTREGYYFLYRSKNNYYKKSLVYPNRTRAMERYHEEKITWMFFYDEQSAKADKPIPKS